MIILVFYIIQICKYYKIALFNSILFAMRKGISPELKDTIDYNPKPLMTTSVHLYLSRGSAKHQKYKKIFEEGFKKLKSSGKYEKLYDDLISGKYSN